MVNKVILNDNTPDWEEITGIVYGSFHYCAQSGSPGMFRYGGAYGSYIEFDYFAPSTITLSVGDVLTYYQTVDVDNSFQPDLLPRDISVGSFRVVEITTTKKSIHVYACDAVSLLDVDFSKRLNALQSSFPMTLEDIVTEAVTVAGASISLPSGDWRNGITINYFYVDGITSRDILRYASEIYGSNMASGGATGIHFTDYHYNVRVYPYGWGGTTDFVIAPDDADYSVGSKYVTNVYYKEDGLDVGKSPDYYDGYVFIGADGSTIGSYLYGSVQNNICYITNNILANNINTLNGHTFNDLAFECYKGLPYANGVMHTGAHSYYPIKATIFPFRNPFSIGEVAEVVDTNGTRYSMPIQFLDLTEERVVLQSYGDVDDSTGYGTKYTSSAQSQTSLAAQINALAERTGSLETDKVSKSGDTMTGSLTLSGTNVRPYVKTALPTSLPNSDTYYDILTGQNSNGVRTGDIHLFYQTADRVGIGIEGARTVNGTAIYNSLRLGIDANGNRTVNIPASAQDAWQTALGFHSNANIESIAGGSNTTSDKFDVPNGYRGVLVISDATATRCGMYIVVSNVNGVVTVVPVVSGSGLTLSTATNKLTIAKSASTVRYFQLSNLTLRMTLA